MRLREIEFLLEQSLPLLRSYNASEVAGTNPRRFRINSLDSIRLALTLLDKTDLFSEIVVELRKTSLYANRQESIEVVQEEYNNIRAYLGVLRDGVINLANSLKRALPEEEAPETVIYVKLPEFNDFDDLAKVLEKLKRAVQIPVTLEEIQGRVVITNFDTGSRWFEITVKSAVAAALVGSLAWAGAVICKKYKEVEIIEEHLKQAKLGTEHLNAVVETNKKQMNLLIEAEANYIHREFFKNHNPEDLERLKVSIKSMSELIQEGTEIKPALLAPENVENLFPDYSNIMLIDSKQKLLENKPGQN